MELIDLIKRTEYKKDADKIARFLEINRIQSVDGISNNMSRLGTKIAGHDIFQFVHALRQEEAKVVAEEAAKATISQEGDEPDSIPILAEEPAPAQFTPDKPGRASKKEN